MVLQRKKMKLKNRKELFFLIFIPIILGLSNSCNSAWFVKKDRIIYRKTGFDFFTNERDYFIPASINRSDNYVECFKKGYLNEVGFLLTGFNRDKRFELIQMYCDTNPTQNVFDEVANGKFTIALPVEIEYRNHLETNSKLLIESRKVDYYVANIKDFAIKCKYNLELKYIIKIEPYYTKEKILRLENMFLDKNKKE